MQVAINNPFDDIGTPPLTRHHILYQHSYLQKRIPSTIVGLVSYTYYVLLILNTQYSIEKEAYAPSLLKLHMLSFRSELYL
ncbi:TPA: hypothetical protein OWY59_000890 [Staphylococcus aureus]|nr:hypothetical protein [Staphylococcus aureus]